MEMNKVIIDPRLFPWAMSYFICGIETIFGKSNVSYNVEPFRCIPTENIINTSCLLFIVINTRSGQVKRYAIDWYDGNTIGCPEVYKWSDVYGKVNTNWEITPKKDYNKLISIGPSFGIHHFSAISALCLLIKVGAVNGICLEQYARYYYREHQRARFSEYRYEPNYVVNGYVFFISTLWYSTWTDNDCIVNHPRSIFIRTLKGMDSICFEGGFVPHGRRNNKRGQVSSVDKFSDCIYGERIDISDYLKKIRKSFIVYNVPACLNCHGWKLGEYLALGKAIISKPLYNDLPHPLEHGINVHYVDGSEKSIRDAVTYIFEHPEYRRKLEAGARQYYEMYCAPVAILESMNVRIK